MGRIGDLLRQAMLQQLEESARNARRGWVEPVFDVEYFEIRDADANNNPVITTRYRIEDAREFGRTLGRPYFISPKTRMTNKKEVYKK